MESKKRGPYNKINPTKPYIKIALLGIPRKKPPPMSEETKKKIGDALRGRPTGQKISSEQRQKMKLGYELRRKENPWKLTSEKYVEIARKRIGYKHNEETLKKLSFSSKKTWNNPEYREKRKKIYTPEYREACRQRSIGNLNTRGLAKTEEQKRRIGEGVKKYFELHPEAKNKFVASLHSKEAREKSRLSRIGKKPSPETLAKRRATWNLKYPKKTKVKKEIIPLSPVNCKHCSISFIPKKKNQIFCSKQCRKEEKKKHRISYYKKKDPKDYSPRKTAKGVKRPEFSGARHPGWKGGVTKQSELDRSSFEYKDWQMAVFKRDNWNCQCCGNHGKNLCSHHILNRSEFPLLKYIVENGITLCVQCHNSFHKRFTVYHNTLEQLNTFIIDNSKMSWI